MMPFIQGAIAAATTACLYRQITAAKEKQETWENVALGANHLLLLAGAALKEAHVHSTAFSLCAKTVFLLTPLVLISSYSKKRSITPFEKFSATRFSQLYYLTTAVSSVAIIALGNKEFGLAALYVLAVDFAVHQKQCPVVMRQVFTHLIQAAALATFIGYAARLSTAVGQTAIFVIGLTVFIPKIVKLLPEDGSEGEEAPRRKKEYYHDDREKYINRREYPYGRDRFYCPPVCPPPSGRSSGSEGPTIRERVGSMVPPLPFDD